MALITVKQRFDLGPTFVLAPERYDPRRDSLKTESGAEKTIALGSIASTVRQTVNPLKRSADERWYVVLDTSDVREGVVIGKKTPVPVSELGSAKKVVRRDDVLISRLRPYLRQVGFVDDDVFNPESGAELACSTEFFVLRSNTHASIAFLVPFLLSGPVQKVLSASQEGGHHPRFDEEALLTLPVPERLCAARDGCSAEVIRAVASYRLAESTLTQLVVTAENAIAPNSNTTQKQKK